MGCFWGVFGLFLGCFWGVFGGGAKVSDFEFQFPEPAAPLRPPLDPPDFGRFWGFFGGGFPGGVKKGCFLGVFWVFFGCFWGQKRGFIWVLSCFWGFWGFPGGPKKGRFSGELRHPPRAKLNFRVFGGFWGFGGACFWVFGGSENKGILGGFLGGPVFGQKRAL